MRRTVPLILAFILVLASKQALGGTVYGTVFHIGDGQPIAGANVDVSFSAGGFPISVGSGISNATGNYTIVSSYAGQVTVRAEAPGFLNTYSIVALPAGSQGIEVNFAMSLPGRISGRVEDGVTHANLSSIRLRLFRANGQPSGSTVTDQNGNYAFEGLDDNAYGVCIINASDIYVDQCWNQVLPNSYTTPTNYQPIFLSSGESLKNIDFSLTTGATISGVVSDRVVNQALADFPIAVTLTDSMFGSRTLEVETDQNGRYILPGLAPSSYRIGLESRSRFYTPQIFRDNDCWINSCFGIAGEPVVISSLGDAPDTIDFRLARGGSAVGRIMDIETGLPLAGIPIALWTKRDSSVFHPTGEQTESGLDGTFSLEHIDSAENILVIAGRSYIQQRWPGGPCLLDCRDGTVPGFFAPEKGAVDAGTISVQRGVVIEGLSRMPGYGAPSQSVNLFDSAGNQIAVLWNLDPAPYRFPAWYPGTYYLISYSPSACQAYFQLPCPSLVTDTTPIIVDQPGTVFEANFNIFVDGVFRASFD